MNTKMTIQFVNGQNFFELNLFCCIHCLEINRIERRKVLKIRVLDILLELWIYAWTDTIMLQDSVSDWGMSE